MPQQRLYFATDKLVNAFMMEKIHHHNSCSCAVGTLCNGTNDWARYHACGSAMEKLRAIDIFNALQFSPKEIYCIEQKFEGRRESILDCKRGSMLSPMTLDNDNDLDGFKGLCNVFDYLVSIEDWKDEESKVNLVEMCLQ